MTPSSSLRGHPGRPPPAQTDGVAVRRGAPKFCSAGAATSPWVTDDISALPSFLCFADPIFRYLVSASRTPNSSIQSAPVKQRTDICLTLRVDVAGWKSAVMTGPRGACPRALWEILRAPWPRCSLRGEGGDSEARRSSHYHWSLENRTYASGPKSLFLQWPGIGRARKGCECPTRD